MPSPDGCPLVPDSGKINGAVAGIDLMVAAGRLQCKHSSGGDNT